MGSANEESTSAFRATFAFLEGIMLLFCQLRLAVPRESTQALEFNDLAYLSRVAVLVLFDLEKATSMPAC